VGKLSKVRFLEKAPFGDGHHINLESCSEPPISNDRCITRPPQWRGLAFWRLHTEAAIIEGCGESSVEGGVDATTGHTALEFPDSDFPTAAAKRNFRWESSWPCNRFTTSVLALLDGRPPLDGRQLLDGRLGIDPVPEQKSQAAADQATQCHNQLGFAQPIPDDSIG